MSGSLGDFRLPASQIENDLAALLRQPLDDLVQRVIRPLRCLKIWKFSNIQPNPLIH